MLLGHDLQDNMIILRKSMIKFECDETDLEILDWSKYRVGTLNR